ncbi:MAG: hypothetical protein KDA57_10625 [Planctomycetales bacterium]|nr:hypothetical protein [Planctomycetales bacterium]
MLLPAICIAEETTVRLRIAWGSGAQAKQRWSGQIEVPGGTFSELQPLGIESDASVATYVDGNRLIVDPLQKRSFDGCDVTVRADKEAVVRFELRSDQSPRATLVEMPLWEIATQQLHRELRESSGFLIAHRSPGDKLRVTLSREHLVFQPNEVWNLGLQPDLAEELATGPVQLEIRLQRTGDTKILWQAGRQFDKDSPENEPIDFEIICPDQEGAYRLAVTARHLEGFAKRILPGQQARLLASREVEFVVVDPQAKQPSLTERWEPVLSIDPANPRWWQRLPSWAQVTRIHGLTQGAVGNIVPVVRPGPAGELVELPAASTEADPYWQSYTLPVRNVGQPHLVEVQYPLASEQHLAISVIEPDASGHVSASSRDAGFYTDGSRTAADGELGIHRFLFWPRTQSPQLLIVNRHSDKPAQFGRISLLRQDAQPEAPGEVEGLDKSARLVACYLSEPGFAESLGAAESTDETSGLSVQTWATFLDGANRLAQHLRRNGYNALVLSAAGDGSSLYPSDALQPSPRYDTGLLAASGQDPVKKDVLELLLRVFDREGLRLVPLMHLASPMPRLEQIRRTSQAQIHGIDCVGWKGTTWLEENATTEGRAPYYNVLNERVQTELAMLATDLADRYSRHPSFAGVGFKVSGEGYGILPELDWAIDDATIAAFSRDTGVNVLFEDDRRFRRRADQLLGPDRGSWQEWRTQKLTGMYTQIAEELAAARGDLRLFLTTEDLFAGTQLQKQLRIAISKPLNLTYVLAEHGLDLARLNQNPDIVALSPSRLGANDVFSRRALDLRFNAAAEEGELIQLSRRSALLAHHESRALRLNSYDERSPFGAGSTQLNLAFQPLPVGEEQRRQLVSALARGDAQIYVEGGKNLSFGRLSETQNLLKTLQHLPAVETLDRSESVQPLVLRVYRSAETVTVLLINESPWPTRVQLPLSSAQPCTWQKLGSHASETPEEQSGTLAAADQDWHIDMKPFDLQAWAFATSELQVGQLKVSLDSSAEEDLRQRIDAVESRTGNLDIRRRYPQLQNPGFELETEGVAIVGWQPLLGSHGEAEVVSSDAHSGSRALRIHSEDEAGAAVQSSLFPMPETGQLMLSGLVRGVAVTPEARLHIILEDAENGRTYRQYAVLGGARAIDEAWSRFEFPVDEIPFATAGQMRVQFHLIGKAEVLLDDIELYDLQFDKLQRGALVKGVYAAKTALDEGQVIDCLHLVEQYWSRYLIEYVPAVEAKVLREAKQPARIEASEGEAGSQGIGDRFRGWVPKLWR